MRILTALIIALTFNLTWAQDEELLEPEKAFAFSVKVNPDGQVDARWNIADGYYMYRDKYDFEVFGDGVELKSIDYPKGKIKQDEFFGDVEVFTGQAAITISLGGESGLPFKLIAKGQGCNEPIGVCYAPQSYTVDLITATIDTLIPPVTAQVDDDTLKMGSDGNNLNSVERLRNLLGDQLNDQGFLDVDEAFQLELQVIDSSNIQADFKVVDGYYLYKDKINFSADENSRIAPVNMPAGEIKEDEYFDRMEVYKHDFNFDMVLQRRDNERTVTIQVGYQGCADQGICYTPVKKRFTLEFPDLIDSASASEDVAGSPDKLMSSNESLTDTQQKKISTQDDKQTVFWTLVLSFIAGIGLTFTPCVLPMIPILAGVIAGQGEEMTRLRGGMLAIVYVLGTVVTYALIGWVAGVSGEQLQAYFQNVWAIGIMSIIFVLMALSMFGLYDIQMPSFVQSSVQEKTSGLSGTIPMVFVLGIFSALVVGACVSPVLISFLGIAMKQGDPVFGAEIMVSMALGMGVPLIIVGFGAGYLLPKAGKWMDNVKYVFGVLLLAVAIYLLGALPQVPVLLLWAALFIIVGVYLGASRPLAEGVHGWWVFLKGLGTLMLIWGALMLVGSFYGERDPFRPLPNNLTSTASSLQKESNQADDHIFERVENLAQLDEKLAEAKAASKKVMLDYYADWCTDCLRMEKTTLLDPRVQSILQSKYIALQVDVTDPYDKESAMIKKRYNVFGPPAVLFFDRDGRLSKERNFYGYKSADDLILRLNN